MKYLCFGHMAETRWTEMSAAERQTMMAACHAYDEELKHGGHFLRGEALQPADSAVTVRWHNGEAVVTDGPYAETREQLGGLLLLEARDMNHAIQLISNHPGVRLCGPFEIRPLDEAFPEGFCDSMADTAITNQ
ncbi:YciI family protein [Abyssibacter sp.]|jgi:hypothetical protein|uniref:YciI family protein n=1 Tax=Abyssibacter sp. TaxID=2320200 RepID=UPI0025BFF28A|nr:YciI family protein [Abyssibacter sp.]MCK5858524.1 hypothetical protein [Abyssibacter sp.]